LPPKIPARSLASTNRFPAGIRRADRDRFDYQRLGEAERAKKIICQEAYRLLTIREGDKVIRMPALQAVLRSQIASAAKGNVAAQRAVIKAAQEIEAGERAGRIGGTENRKSRKDVNEVTDEELMAVLRAAQNDTTD
jgi:Family of unknown function (DUF5681)